MMKTVSKGKIFLSDQRGIKETEKIKRWSTLNFESFSNPDKSEIDQLYFFNDEMLAGKQKTCFEINRDSYIIILPVTGSVNYLDDCENETDVDVEEAIVVYVEKGANITLSNPFENEVINYLCMGIEAKQPMPNNPRFYNFDLCKNNQLLKINVDELPFKLSIGRFDGRKEVEYLLETTAKTFAFVITGAFEIDGRLLHEKDGLALWGTTEVELEALSNSGVILIVELN
jgi:hypothetical protein